MHAEAEEREKERRKEKCMCCYIEMRARACVRACMGVCVCMCLLDVVLGVKVFGSYVHCWRMMDRGLEVTASSICLNGCPLWNERSSPRMCAPHSTCLQRGYFVAISKRAY